MYLEFIEACLKDVAEIARKNFGLVSSISKSSDNNQVLTEVDIKIGTLLIRRINESYPEHNIIDEEAGAIDKGSEYTWIIDPIDGTSNFASGILTYGIMIGLLKDNEPIAGGVALPELSSVYVASKGKGAFCNDQEIQVSTETSLLSSLVAYGIDGHQENPDLTHKEVKILGDIVLGIRNLRTSNSAYDAMMVASGKYGATLNKTSKIWDNVAPHIIIKEAGGIYTDFYGKPMDYSKPLLRIEDNFTWCAASPSLHQQLQKIINKTE
jgi:myo-inositol-1(or 4)-monophosphatase